MTFECTVVFPTNFSQGRAHAPRLLIAQQHTSKYSIILKNACNLILLLLAETIYNADIQYDADSFGEHKPCFFGGDMQNGPPSNINFGVVAPVPIVIL